MEPHPQTAAAPFAVGKVNTFALVSFIAAFFVPVVGVVFGHVALSQIRRTHEDGHGFALAGIIIGYCLIALFVVFFVVWILFFFQMMALPNT